MVFIQVIIMGILILLGVVCYKIKMINKEVTKSLSSLVLMVVNPVVILISYQTPFNKKLLVGLLSSFFLAAICYAVSILVSGLIVRNKADKENISIEKFSCIYSNCGFMGIPLVNGLYGSEGVFYLTAYMTLFNLLVWTHGVILMNGKCSVKMVLSALKSPAIIATAVGFVLFMLNIALPEIIIKTLNYIGSMNTPMAMIVAGATIAQTDIMTALKKKRVYFISFIKLILIPGIILIVFSFMPFNEILAGTNILAAACPAATTGILFSIRYNKNPIYASEIFAMTTILSIVTLPLIMCINSYI